MTKHDMNKRLILIATILSVMVSCTRKQKDYPIRPVPFTDVRVADNFWAPRIKINQEVTIPIALRQCEITGRIRNFKIAGKLEKGSFCSQYPFDDTDIYKIIEGASYSLQLNPDPKLEAYIDTLIHYIALAQEPDGYLFTNRTINPDSLHPWVGKKRWEKDTELSHELYNCGHLYEAAVAHYLATGKRTMLDIAIKNANLLDKDFNIGKLPYYPGHQIVEMGLVRLFRVTGDERYLKLAKYFLDIRGPGGDEYNQAHVKIFEQDKVVGHAVRATYMYSGMADVAAMYGNDAYSKPLDKIWADLIGTKYYITGGIGSSGSNEGFGEPYDLPNMSAYCETCASIGMVYWNYRMFLLTGDPKYYDVLERTLYNALLSGVSLSGDHFFYPNVLESRGQHARSEWFGCACCPSNICRFLPSVPGYAYAVKDDQVYVNLYMQSSSTIEVNGRKVGFVQETNYPWQGAVSMKVTVDKPTHFTLKLRVPSWVNGDPVPSDLYSFACESQPNVVLSLNGEQIPAIVEGGYISIGRKWANGDNLSVEFPMSVRVIKANPKVKADEGKIALQRGPLVYCLEWPDNGGEKILSFVVDPEQQFSIEYKPELLNGVEVVKGTAIPSSYIDGKVEMGAPVEFVAIPYYAWSNRGSGDMSVWMATSVDKSRPTPTPTIASRSSVTASVPRKSLMAINDLELPENSNDHAILYHHWWPMNNNTVWIEYRFEKTATVSRSSVYWFDDGPFGGCRVPQSWRLLYRAGNRWMPVNARTTYGVAKDCLNTVEFSPVNTIGLKLEVTLPKEYSAGLYEWTVE